MNENFANIKSKIFDDVLYDICEKVCDKVNNQLDTQISNRVKMNVLKMQNEIACSLRISVVNKIKQRMHI